MWGLLQLVLRIFAFRFWKFTQPPVSRSLPNLRPLDQRTCQPMGLAADVSNSGVASPGVHVRFESESSQFVLQTLACVCVGVWYESNMNDDPVTIPWLTDWLTVRSLTPVERWCVVTATGWVVIRSCYHWIVRLPYLIVLIQGNRVLISTSRRPCNVGNRAN